MKALILTSSLDTNYKDELENRIPQDFGNFNGIKDTLKKYIDKYENFLYVASSNDYDITDMYASVMIRSFEISLPFENYNILDMRNANSARELVEQADLIILCGGHVPTQNKLFNELNLKELIQNTNAVICGCSAGSMNAADKVYCHPELEGEALDKNFKKFYKGLGLTDINIFPHFDLIKDECVDGKHNLNDFIIPDSFELPIICLNEGSYIVVGDNVSTIFGESYLAVDGNLKQICKSGEQSIITL